MTSDKETLTAEERDDVEDLPGRQPGCPDKTCSVCRANARRGDALTKLLRIHDAQAARIAELEDDNRELREKLFSADAQITTQAARITELERMAVDLYREHGTPVRP